MKDISRMGMRQEASIVSNKNLDASLALFNYYHVECLDSDGNLRWEETIKNLVTTEGLDYIMNAGFKSGSQIGTWYVGLKKTGAAAADDTAANLGAQAWLEYTEYDEATREALTLGSVVVGSVDNVGNVASFTIGSPAPDVYGVFVVDDNTKDGQSPATVLYGVGDFVSPKVVDANDTLNVTVTLTAASA